MEHLHSALIVRSHCVKVAVLWVREQTKHKAFVKFRSEA